MSTEPGTNEVRIEKLVYGGDGLARDNGRVILTPFVLPEERVSIRAKQVRKDLIRADLVSIEERSPERTEPGCPYFGRCGGCDYQHARYPYQLQQKVEILREVLRRIGKIEAPETVEILSAEPWQYRNRSQLHLQNGRIGYLEEHSHKLCAIDHCPISSPKINEAIGVLRSMMQDRRFPHFVESLELFTNESEIQLNVLQTARPVNRKFFEWWQERMPGAVSGAIDYAVGSSNFRVSGKSFFQVNRFLIPALVERATAGRSGQTAIDLYAGVGLFSLELARNFASVTAVEAGISGYEDLQVNAQRANLAVTAIRQQVESFLMQQEARPDFLLADPPRAGLGKLVVKELLRLKPPNIVVIACDPSTLARDAAGLLAGGYELSRLTMVDLFPQTYHMETVAEFSAK